MNDFKFIKERFLELSGRAVHMCSPISTDFLTLFEQNILAEIKLPCCYKLYGGTEYAERKLCVFYPYEYAEESLFSPAVFIEISPKNKKFAEMQSHRDFLGAILNLGIKREMIGDIYLSNDRKTAFVYIMNKMTEYICDNLNRVGHNAVCVVKAEYKSVPTIPFDIKLLTVISKRADLIVADIFNLSRGVSKKLFSDEKIFINGRLCIRAEKLIEINDVVSVRGFGKFKINEEKGTSKKGKIKLEIAKFI